MTNNSSPLLHEAFFNKLFQKEYDRLRVNGQVYLDFTGGNLHAQSQIDEHFKLLSEAVLGNPHSINPSSLKTTELVASARQKVIDFFNAGDYYCIFTQNASAALKIVGECYPFESKGSLVLLADNHNSVNGIREYCETKNASYQYASIQYEDLQINSLELNELLCSNQEKENKLFAFPAQSNVSGVKHDLKWIDEAQSFGWDVLLDAAAYVPTNALDLKVHRADFVTLSFYKIFGFPTGIGCLLVKKDKFHKLIKPWFAGGTVTMVGVKSSNHYLINSHERFENGTINYLAIPAVETGINYMEHIGMQRLNERVNSLMNYLYQALISLKHDNGTPLIKVFGPSDRKETGSNLILNIFDSENNLYPFELIEQLAAEKEISIRSGCFCNPGIDEVTSCLTLDELTKYFSSRDQGDYHDMMHYLQKMRGANRVSVGIATRKSDLDTFLSFVDSFKNKSVPSNWLAIAQT